MGRNSRKVQNEGVLNSQVDDTLNERSKNILSED